MKINKENIFKLGFILLIFTLFLINAFHESYPDEFDNILGGWYIANGRLPYIGFFTHHGPIAYFIAATITLFSGQSFVNFRVFYSLILALSLFGIYFLLKKRIGKEQVSFFPFFMIFIGIEATYYWTHMLLADNVAAFSFLPIYALILLKTVFRKVVTKVDLVIVAILSSIGLYSSLTYTYLFFFLSVSILYLYFKDNHIKRPLFSFFNFLPFLILASPHLLFFLYLLITQSLGDYFYQNFIFNSKYYIYNYPRPENSSFINPIRYAILIFHWFFINFYILLLGVKNFDFAFPINLTMAVGNMGLILYLLFKKHYKLALLVLLTIVFTNIRSDPLKSKETDYQSGVYNIISFFNIFFLLPALYKELNERIETAKKIIFGSLFFIIGIYSFFSLLHLIFKFNQKTVSKYMGDMPLIYDRPRIAPIINSIVNKNDYAWIGPFEFEELFYLKAKIPSKYHILIYGIGVSDKIRNEMISDFNKNKPVVIYFDKQFDYLGKEISIYGKEFLNFLETDYTTLLNYKSGNIKYQSKIPIHTGEKLDLEKKLYIRKDKKELIIKKLLKNNFIQESIYNE